MKLIIQIPCYNEANTLKIALDDLPKHIAGIDEIGVLIIDDGCTDDTAYVARDWGVDYIVKQRQNKGLAKGFMAGLDACLKNGADIIVNTDADNQYCGADIEKLVRPILDKKSHIVIGSRPIEETEHFSPLKKRLQRFGSWVVRKASKTNIPDAPSGFRAFSREAALRMCVINEYTYTLETIVQAGRSKIDVMSVPIRTNPELRKSRLFSSMWGYVRRSMLTILRAILVYKPLLFFIAMGSGFSGLGAILFIRYLILFGMGKGSGHSQSLILASTLLIIGFISIVAGLLGDLFSANRKLLEEARYYARKKAFDEAAGKSPESYEDIEYVKKNKDKE